MLYPLLSEENYGTKTTPQGRRQIIVDKWTRQPGNVKETAEKIEMDPQDKVAQEVPSSSSDQFISPSENVKYKTIKRIPPKIRESTRNRASAQKRANPQGVWIGHD